MHPWFDTRAAVGCLALFGAVACASESPESHRADVAKTDAPAAGTFCKNGSGTCAEAEPAPASANTCAADAQMVYVVTETSRSATTWGPPIHLWSYWPPTSDFKKIGEITCLPDGVTNMTVDRKGNAWVMDFNGGMYRVSTKDASCSPLGNWPPRDQDKYRYSGLYSFAFAGLNNDDTRLHLLQPAGGDHPNPELFAFDLQSGDFEHIGTPLAGDPSLGTMTANGDGKLYFLNLAVSGWTKSYPLHEIDPASAKVLSTKKPKVTQFLGGMGLAYFGTQFYLFMDTAISSFDPASEVTTPIGTAPGRVMGAGQSTCVPNRAVAKGTPPPH